MPDWKVCHLYWGGYERRDVYNADERGSSSKCFLIEPWHMKENLAMVENIPKTDSLCNCVLIMMEVTNKCRL
jgi:hypothetical protein